MFTKYIFGIQKNQMKKYCHLFFDLDRTIWDFQANSRETFRDILQKHQLDLVFQSVEEFETMYHEYNDLLWNEYRNGKIHKDVLRWKRFYLTLQDVGIQNEELAKTMDFEYISISPTKTKLFPGATEVLEYLFPKYPLHIITNGFTEVQFIKLKNSNLNKYFTRIITSEIAGSHKPKREIFHYAVSSANAKKSESLMIGDDLETDIKGAMDFGLDQVYFNPARKPHELNPTYEIVSLKELMNFL